MRYGKLVNGVIADVFTEPAGFVIAECLVPEFVLMYEAIPDGVDVGWVKHADGTFTAPVVVVDIPVV